MTRHEPSAMDQRRRPTRADSGSSGAWLITFADLAAIILAFFVLKFSMSEVEDEKWRTAATALGRQFNMPGQLNSPGQGDGLGLDSVTPKEALSLDYLAALLSTRIEAEPRLRGADMQRVADRLVISLPDRLLFDQWSASLRPGAEETLFVLAGALGVVPNRVDIVGHTDPTPPPEQSYPSNWELSLSRAATVAVAFRAAGYTRGIGVFGRASGQFQQLDPALPISQRQSIARRVDIIVREDGGLP